MAKRVSVDGWLFTVTLLLVFIGLIMVFSASAVMAKERYGSGYFFLFRQLVWAIAGITAMFIAMRVDYRRLKHPGFVFSLVGITTLLLILVFFLDRSHNTHRWIHWGAFSFSLRNSPSPCSFCSWHFFSRAAPNPWTTGGTRCCRQLFLPACSSASSSSSRTWARQSPARPLPYAFFMLPDCR